MEITLEEIQKKFEGLPEDLKWAIMAAKVDDNIIDIGNAQGLNVEQMGQLSLETHMEMFGFTHPDKFEESIKNSLKLSDEKTHSIANAINEKILKEIRAKIMKPSYEAPTAEKTSPEEEKDNEILTSAGIEIIPDLPAMPSTQLMQAGKLELNSPTLLDKEGNEGRFLNNSPHPNPLLIKERENASPILTRKLSDYVKNEVVKTEHSLNNLTKSGEQPAKIASYKDLDPYREKPE